MAEKLPLWIKVRIPITRRELRDYWGPKCCVYQRGCPVCEAYKSFARYGKVYTLIERRKLFCDDERGFKTP